ncbi:hypothetical protein Snov_2127 [Ancylobacter novellus DSM 506]|uniref:Uncharacterized protein n=1 Tax=Ancylobacter novellus (strain ATCC 8093 / DSM 506 / JCM 20403 / CCM 1077 / IAM 12100 / NBRC 12443 / NCIMB 10456) TaxID=639283 RepID=D7A165_ANCN5|nr:hypothetical protein Snov_2127 [Ancylobacter novellus DSM 506]
MEEDELPNKFALIPGLDPGTQPFRLHPVPWVAGSSPAMREEVLSRD